MTYLVLPLPRALLQPQQADLFRKKGKALRNQMWWDYCKWKLLVFFELLVDKTDVLRNQADLFRKKGKALRNQMWWDYCKWKLLVFFCLLILAVIIFLAACFSGGRDCTQQDAGSKIVVHTDPQEN
eukprot:CAMPEP_0202420178 /NCGR_PEP_ID=MMETSP1128-20130828/49684_1 /ASSEMBLY_ACC=CAM_ASM_000463 /TAXON_ID=3047 /ORGANISM="Dunaliella tertiolecta, Strain CCMP1320" /LENGTH=125 /DNA_ID=CAMNT_0049028153 /DNA_START=397 /DNA_END=773 /DNA_ORIENTATION=+